MSLENGNLLEETDQYRFVQSLDRTTLLFEWKHIPGLSPRDFRTGIAEFAKWCKNGNPDYAVIDASALDQDSPAVAWLRAQPVDGEDEDYQTWWMRNVVPLYNDANIVCLAVGIGDPNAPGELDSIPGADFKIGYFPDTEIALAWRPN